MQPVVDQPLLSISVLCYYILSPNISLSFSSFYALYLSSTSLHFIIGLSTFARVSCDTDAITIDETTVHLERYNRDRYEISYG